MSHKIELKEEFERQAEWRDEKAEQHPDDKRNREAAELHRQLAATVEQCPEEVTEAVWELFDDEPDTLDWLEMMRAVGFHY